MTEDIEPPEQDARIERLAKRLLMGEGDAPPSAWLQRGDLLQRTWAWQAARRQLETQGRPAGH